MTLESRTNVYFILQSLTVSPTRKYQDMAHIRLSQKKNYITINEYLSIEESRIYKEHVVPC